MMTRSLSVWNGPEYNDSIPPDETYIGPYSEVYEKLPEQLQRHPAGWTAFRLGRIQDTVKCRVITFRQIVKRRDEPCPNCLFACEQPNGGFPAWRRNEDGTSSGCDVWDVDVRNATEEGRSVVGSWPRECQQTEPDGLKLAQRPGEGESARVRALEARTLEDAVNHLASAYPDLETAELHAGMMNAKGLTWAAMMKRARCGKATLSKRLARFYTITDWPRPDRRKGMGKKLHLDEARDGEDPQEDMFAEHSEHPRTRPPAKGEQDRLTR